jgi:hypothetical protein
MLLPFYENITETNDLFYLNRFDQYWTLSLITINEFWTIFSIFSLEIFFKIMTNGIKDALLDLNPIFNLRKAFALRALC